MLLKRLPLLFIRNKISLHSVFYMQAGNVEFNLHVYKFYLHYKYVFMLHLNSRIYRLAITFCR